MTAPPDVEPRAEPAHDEDFRVTNLGWWAIGGALGTALTAALAFVILMAMTGEPEYTNRPGGGEAAVVAGAEAVGEITLVASEFAYQPDHFTGAEELTITLDNQGSVLHNLVVDGVPESDFVIEAEPGATGFGTIALAPGDYVVFCSIPGHREAGMEGELTITGA